MLIGAGVMFMAWLLMLAAMVASIRVFLLQRPAYRRWLWAQLAIVTAVALMAAGIGYWLQFPLVAVKSVPRSIGPISVLLVYVLPAMLLYLATLAACLIPAVVRGYCRARRELQAARLRLLRNQLNPHFLFNSLNAIAELCYRDPHAADRTITQLSELLRRSLAASRVHEISLEDELQFLRRYLAIQQTLLQGRLAISYEIATDTLTARVPSMILQPLVENAIIHGLANSGAGRILIRAARAEGMLHMEVEDDGRGLAEGGLRRDGTGIGLSNSRLRLAYLYAGRAKLELRSNPVKGVTASLDIPFHEADAYAEDTHPHR